MSLVPDQGKPITGVDLLILIALPAGTIVIVATVILLGRRRVWWLQTSPAWALSWWDRRRIVGWSVFLLLMAAATPFIWRDARARREEERRYRLSTVFDPIIYSHEIGFAKPDIRAFMRAIELAGAPAHRMAFVDDTEANVEAALSVGMHAVHHVTNTRTIARIDELTTAHNVREQPR